MADDKLSKWLTDKGFLNKPESKKPQTTGAQAPKPKPGTPEKTGAQKSLFQNPEKKPTPNGPEAKKGPVNRPNRPNNKPKGGPPGRGKQQFSNHDPLAARPTVEKRDKFHPTNFLPKGNTGEIRVVPLGGMEQVGENMMFLEWGDDIVVIDTGFLFPGPEHFGIDVLIPDISYLEKNKHKIRAVIYTHGHLDHIGGAPYILPKLGYPPVYATKLTSELLFAQCSEHEGVNRKINVKEITPKSRLKLGKFEFEFFHINHSIPDGVAIVARTPYGAIVHSSDFKFDYNPSDDQPIDLGRIAAVGKAGVAVAMVDSTSTMKPGQTKSESVIAQTIDKLIGDSTGRIILATFSSNIGRVAKIVESAERHGRTVFLSGRSMERNIAIARKLNYLKCKDKTLQRMSFKANKMDPSKILILSTGSQGEELAALTRMSAGTHRDIKLTKDDTVLFSSSPIPGNELAIVSVLNNLSRIGCKKVDHKELDLHVSGHAHAEESKLMVSLLNPKYFAPIHGEVFMRYAHQEMIVNSLQIKKENTFLMDNGRGIVLSEKGARLMTEKEALSGPETLVQLGEVVHDKIVEERKFMQANGIIITLIKQDKGTIKDISFRTKGFLYGNDEKHEIFELLRKNIQGVWDRTYDPSRPTSALVSPIENAVHKVFLQKFRQEQLVEVLID